MVFPSRKEVELVTAMYKEGDKVELLEMDDPYTTLKSGAIGTVKHVDGTATVFVKWENGETLGVVYGVDRIRKI